MRQLQTILLAEDDQDDLFLMKRAFKQAEVPNPVTVVRDGQQAINYLASEGEFSAQPPKSLPGLVLLDLKLPKKNGLEVLHWIRDQAALKHLLVVMLTNSRADSDIERAYRLGANSYLVKPATAQKLCEMVKTLRFYWLVLNRPPILSPD